MSELARGAAVKMRIELQEPARYGMRLGEEELPLNELLGQSLHWSISAESTASTASARPTRVLPRAIAGRALASWRSATVAS